MSVVGASDTTGLLSYRAFAVIENGAFLSLRALAVVVLVSFWRFRFLRSALCFGLVLAVVAVAVVRC